MPTPTFEPGYTVGVVDNDLVYTVIDTVWLNGIEWVVLADGDFPQPVQINEVFPREWKPQVGDRVTDGVFESKVLFEFVDNFDVPQCLVMTDEGTAYVVDAGDLSKVS